MLDSHYPPDDSRLLMQLYSILLSGRAKVRCRGDVCLRFGLRGRASDLYLNRKLASPLAKEIKEYAATKRKVRDYQRFFNIQSNRCNLFFFAVESSGGLGKEARFRKATGETRWRANGVGHPTHLPDVSCGDSKRSSKPSLYHKKEIRNRHTASSASGGLDVA
jgi:hypothetical protein